jgi:hypothetical protein
LWVLVLVSFYSVLFHWVLKQSSPSHSERRASPISYPIFFFKWFSEEV